ncbi:ribonuclease P protein component [Riemerella columbipharyngis]|uniref:Ribonuclease P protein component n=1 Tax=Riemerella columbipharyngis TaxID=1071918 RepID=A0A1G7C2R5_9FLAO|nr:ribonuclease P protein component [Riemerella columbipharyngis]SDE33632.1 ribonuclease P protein component [Riemerella columbipharyngis]
MTDYTLPKTEKLKRKSEISLLFEKGKWHSYGSVKIIVLQNDGGTQVGVSVSKRFFKRAVHRNRTKRLMREVYRLNKDMFHSTFGKDTLMMLFWVSPQLPQSYREVEKHFVSLCRKYQK